MSRLLSDRASSRRRSSRSCILTFRWSNVHLSSVVVGEEATDHRRYLRDKNNSQCHRRVCREDDEVHRAFDHSYILLLMVVHKWLKTRKVDPRGRRRKVAPGSVTPGSSSESINHEMSTNRDGALQSSSRSCEDASEIHNVIPTWA